MSDKCIPRHLFVKDEFRKAAAEYRMAIEQIVAEQQKWIEEVCARRGWICDSSKGTAIHFYDSQGRHLPIGAATFPKEHREIWLSDPPRGDAIQDPYLSDREFLEFADLLQVRIEHFGLLHGLIKRFASFEKIDPAQYEDAKANVSIGMDHGSSPDKGVDSLVVMRGNSIIDLLTPISDDLAKSLNLVTRKQIEKGLRDIDNAIKRVGQHPRTTSGPEIRAIPKVYKNPNELSDTAWRGMMKVKGTFRTTTDVEIVTMDAWDDIRRRVLKQYKADHPHVHKDANRINRNGLWMYDDPHSGHYSQDEIYGEATDADKAFMKHLDVIASLLLKHERQSS